MPPEPKVSRYFKEKNQMLDAAYLLLGLGIFLALGFYAQLATRA